MQTEMYNTVKDNIVGYWEGTESQSSGTWKSTTVSVTYQFNSDGTYEEHWLNLVYTGTYRISKNPDYLTYPLSYPKVLIRFNNETTGITSDMAIEIDINGYLYIDYITLGIKDKSIWRYTKCEE